MNAAVRNTDLTIATTIERTGRLSSIFTVTGRETIVIKAGTTITIGGERHDFQTETPVDIISLVAGQDYGIRIDAGMPVAVPAGLDFLADAATFGGFHFAPGGNAPARSGGDDIPAINPFSCWDADFRPVCADPRGMALVDLADGGKVWIDIYKLNVDHLDNGTSRFGVTIADGDSLPQKPGGKGKVARLDYATAVVIYAHHGKQLLSYDEFRAATYGVTEKTAASKDPKTTGLDAARTSRFGIMQGTGNLWDWGHDGDPDMPRASRFGGDWWNGGSAGSRYADLVPWAGYSYRDISASGRSDHLTPA